MALLRSICLSWMLVLLLSSVVPAQEPTPEPSAAAPVSVESGELRIGAKEVARLFRGWPAIPMWTLVGCGILTVMFAVERLVVSQSRRVAPPAFTKRILAHLRDETLTPELVQELQGACRNDGSIAAQLFATVIENHGRPAIEIRTAVADIADIELYSLRKHVRAIAGLAAIAPLLGLFGTVIGMIEAFQALSQQSGPGKTEYLAGGISLALIATAAGLAVAVLGSIAYYFLQGRVDLRIHELDQLMNQAVTFVASDTVRETPRRSRGSAAESGKLQASK